MFSRQVAWKGTGSKASRQSKSKERALGIMQRSRSDETDVCNARGVVNTKKERHLQPGKAKRSERERGRKAACHTSNGPLVCFHAVV